MKSGAKGRHHKAARIESRFVMPFILLSNESAFAVSDKYLIETA